MTEEQSLREQLIILHRHYMEACEPIIRRLAAIESMKPPSLITLLPAERECCGTFPKTPHRKTCENWRGKK